LNKWNRNYWGERGLSYRILGEMNLMGGYYWGAPPDIVIPFFKLDRHPARKPYHIPIN
jgi:hypothetical protein